MSNETYAMLEELYRPYNERLFALLGWDADVWDNSHFLEKQAELSKDADVSQDDETSSIELEHIFEPPYFDEAKGQKFTDQWCVLDNVSWYPEPNQIWQLRAPYFILPGAKKSGTTSVASYLMQHPLVERARTKELQFFLTKNFLPDYLTDDNKTLVREAREHLYTTDYHANVLSRNNSLMSFDGTPGYLFDGVNMVRRILCVSPWVKLVIVLRNPVDLAFSNWAFVMWRHRVKHVVPFETYLDHDMRALNISGVLDAKNAEEEDAWTIYRTHRVEGAIGRSIYDIQIRQWFLGLENIGRDPRTQVHFVRSDELKKDIQGTMRKVHDFLGIPHAPVLEEKELVVTKYSEPIHPATRRMLEQFYEPYNQRLYKLLAAYGFGEDWHGYWDRKQQSA
ncbi:[heparan sulfate]-glucosamine 3-sulfotransferase-like protein [Fragilaria crotonensis]|nr:[heparan sulfate]-glucosamine 3-sulfotransferase-like protein [Fragilaria crotonensis]